MYFAIKHCVSQQQLVQRSLNRPIVNLEILQGKKPGVPFGPRMTERWAYLRPVMGKQASQVSSGKPIMVGRLMN